MGVLITNSIISALRAKLLVSCGRSTRPEGQQRLSGKKKCYKSIRTSKKLTMEVDDGKTPVPVVTGERPRSCEAPLEGLRSCDASS